MEENRNIEFGEERAQEEKKNQSERQERRELESTTIRERDGLQEAETTDKTDTNQRAMHIEGSVKQR